MCRQFFNNVSPVTVFMKTRPAVIELFRAERWKDGRTDGRKWRSLQLLSQLLCERAWRRNLKIWTGYFSVLPSIRNAWLRKTANSPYHDCHSPSWKQRGIFRQQNASLNNSDIMEEVSQKFPHILISALSLPSLQIQATSLQSTHSSYYILL